MSDEGRAGDGSAADRVRFATNAVPQGTFDHAKIREGVRLLLEGIGLDPEAPAIEGTPERVARMYDEVFAGLLVEPGDVLDVMFEEGHDELILQRDIPFASLCVPSKQKVNAVDGAKCARNVRPGDLLWTFDGAGCLAQTEVVSVRSRKTYEMVRIRAGSGAFDLTPEHPVLARGRGWTRAGDLEPGDHVQWLHSRRLCMDRHPVHEGYALGYVIGAVGAEASIQDGRRVSFVVSDLAFAEKYRKCLHEAFELDAEIHEVDVPSGFLQREVRMYRVRVVSRHLAHLLLMWFGERGEQKETKGFHFPRVVLRSREMMGGFLDGYCDGDGCSTQNGSRTIASANRTFLRELGEVLATRPQPWPDKPGGDLRVSQHWDKPGWYGKPGFHPQDEPLRPPDATWTRVASAERVDASGTKPYTVYSFQCHPYPTFLVGGVLTHNCEHHLVPFVGRAHVGYIPNDRGAITGLSKLARLVDVVAKRPNVQERITTRVADTMVERLEPRGVIVIIEAEHLCLTMRGVRKPGSMTVTSAVRGIMRDDPRSRAEAMALATGRHAAG